MHCGYVESCRTSLLVYQCDFFGIPGYESMKQAITDLALDLYNKYYEECLSIYENRYLRGLKDCCRNALIADHDAKFCSKCGIKLKDKDFDTESFMHYISDLHGSTCDDYGSADESGFHWWPYCSGAFIGAPKEEVIYIAECAEYVLLSALIEAKPELAEAEESYRNRDWLKFREEIQPSYT
jgi:hypothetical protein